MIFVTNPRHIDRDIGLGPGHMNCDVRHGFKH